MLQCHNHYSKRILLKVVLGTTPWLLYGDKTRERLTLGQRVPYFHIQVFYRPPKRPCTSRLSSSLIFPLLSLYPLSGLFYLVLFSPNILYHHVRFYHFLVPNILFYDLNHIDPVPRQNSLPSLIYLSTSTSWLMQTQRSSRDQSATDLRVV